MDEMTIKYLPESPSIGGFYAVQRGFKAVIKAASDAEETQAKFNVVFGLADALG